MSPLFQAALEATEEAVYNSLLKATTVTGNGGTAEAMPIDRVREILKKFGDIVRALSRLCDRLLRWTAGGHLRYK